ncbi:MAG: DUF485 domain-containing protein [Planctomycetaceae bacterium]
MQPRQSRDGLALFLLYTAMYLGFIYINAFNPGLMKKPAFAGVNTAVVYGFSLIVAAIVMAFLYGFFGEKAQETTEQDHDHSTNS